MSKLPYFFFLLIFQSHIFLASNLSDTAKIKNHLIELTKTEKYRNYTNIDQLNTTANYIRSNFSEYTCEVVFQEFSVNGQTYKNVIGSFGPIDKPRIIVGAHYDVCGNQEGADDNASGVVGLLELARLLNEKSLNNRIDLVAYSLEEPPFFKTQDMGSYIHAKSLHVNEVEVLGMISLEMIGYFSDRQKSQLYPLGILSLFYGNTGNFITLVKRSNSGKFSKDFSKLFRSKAQLPTKLFTGPRSLQGVDFSDHLNYWDFGYSALMITDTSFYRNRNYHQITDTLETLDIAKLAKVIDGIFETLIAL